MQATTVYSINDLSRIPGGQIAQLRNWSFKVDLGAVEALDGTGRRISVYGTPKDLRDKLNGSPHTTWIMDMYVRVEYVYDHDPFAPPGSRVELYYYEPVKSSCDCGAVFTSFKDRHYDWCSAKKWGLE